MKCFIFILLTACSLSQTQNPRTKITEGKNRFNLKDATGNYLVEREVKRVGPKIVTRTVLKNWQNISIPLEKSITVSLSGRLSNGTKSLLPLTSQFSVWFDKKKYFSQIKVNKKQKTVSVLKQSPEAKWNGKVIEKAPKARYICFFSSLPECLSEQNLLVLSRNAKIDIFIIWDNYPYYVEQYEGVSGKLITLAQFSFSSMLKDSLRFELDIGNQVIFYHFNRRLEFDKMFWVSQGISLERQTKN